MIQRIEWHVDQGFNINIMTARNIFGVTTFTIGHINLLKPLVRQVAHRIHPDVNPIDPTANAKTSMLLQAAKLLIDQWAEEQF